MTGAEWIAEKINTSNIQGTSATAESDEVVFVRRTEKSSEDIGVVPNIRRNLRMIVSTNDVEEILALQPEIAMMVVIPREARWSRSAMEYLQSQEVAFGGVGDLYSAICYDNDISIYRNKTFAFVDDGLRRHSRVADLNWVDSGWVEVHLKNKSVVTVALNGEYDITMDVAREASRISGNFDILLKTNPNGSITSDGAENVKQLGFRTLKWGEIFGYLAKNSGQARNDHLRERLRRIR